jgi:hypothetical protein
MHQLQRGSAMLDPIHDNRGKNAAIYRIETSEKAIHQGMTSVLQPLRGVLFNNSHTLRIVRDS